MSPNRSFRRTPRGGVDPIRSADDAIAVLALAAPFGHDTIAIPLDQRRCGSSIMVVKDTLDPDALFTVIDSCIEAALGVDEIDGLILATGRPHGGTRPDDVHRWLEASDQCQAGGLELVEWFVIGRRISFPRELFGEPDRWAG